jgi:hypothetical protein
MKSSTRSAWPVADGACPPPTFTLVTNNVGRLSKAYFDDGNGGFRKDAEPPLSAAYTRRVHVAAGEAGLEAFAAVLDGLNTSQAIILGDHDGSDKMHLVSKKRLHENPGALTRTADVFRYRAGQPAFVGLDHDAKDLPTELREAINAAGGLVAVLDRVAPGMAAAGHVLRASVSTGIVNSASGRVNLGGGEHGYWIATDGAGAQAFVKRLDKRLVIAGYGFPFLSSAGSILVRSPIDLAASGDPCRLWYEGRAELGEGLAYREGARTPRVYPGPLLDLDAVCPALTEDEERAYAVKRAELRASRIEEAHAIQAKRAGERREQRVARGLGTGSDPVKFGDLDEPIILYGEAEILLDDGEVVSVLDIVREPRRFDGVTCADPLEWDYGGGKNKAIILSAKPWPEIFSHAHGGQRFRLRLNERDLFALLSKETRNG